MTDNSNDSESQVDIKRVIEMTLDLNDTNSSYQPGDYVAVYAPNPDYQIKTLISRLQLNENKVIKIESLDSKYGKYYIYISNGNTIYNIFRDLLDITGIPSKKLLKLLAEHSSDPNEKLQLNKLSSVEGKEEYAQMINDRTTLLCLLEKYKTSSPPLAHLLDILNPLAPRDYSISSSPLSLEAGKISFVFSVLPNQSIESSLSELNINNSDNNIITKIPFQLKSSPHFHLPSEDQLSKPIIMIGPGTGVAPFIGFLQHLSKINIETKPLLTWLFFGCRSEKKDFLYKDTLHSMLQDSTLTKLTTAFSRELDINNHQDPNLEVTCGYVQEKMKNHSKELYDLIINKNAFVYICGDAKGMAVGVRNSFIDIIKQESSVDEKIAVDMFTNLIKEKRYILDVWS
ncbi:hypothetical protein DICPUDRAFT_43883 [Dictyostelium purpureum]|uniref:FAD-binding FR-type domain-containing protein n=1 Tax=Dictyostelium purpureum TaxID=5786 RepID=F1A508_DICPU|nr:uncharacterized protein DICPUDRAFT_43883 [Dictyostelium purpureum]EGC28725.1 hypothetical protein DICPUDRAFT_43883 [Dictyostelium purpureum]|eukprot:XP_003294752.1 hypothetical protein DICPUDRAFT_43883 [Dictyostelium purpureum]